MKDLVPFLFLCAPYVPTLIIHCVGATLCILRWRHHPRRSRLALLAFLLFAARVIETIVTECLKLQEYRLEGDTKTISSYLGIIGLFEILAGYVAWTFLLMALFERHDAPVAIVGQNGLPKDNDFSAISTQ